MRDVSPASSLRWSVEYGLTGDAALVDQKAFGRIWRTAGVRRLSFTRSKHRLGSEGRFDS